ncbi:MAG: sensor histidine kinase [Nitrospirae bacterium]|nr:MAG: sensor histidine kinase [Nitrospirota bacterium]
MYLQKKILLSFFVSALVIALLSVFLYLNFIEMKKETAFLEMTDTVRSKSLQLRRHEKNYFLFTRTKADDESKAIYRYLTELEDITKSVESAHIERIASLKSLIQEYRVQFAAIEKSVGIASGESERLKKASPAYAKVSGLLEANFLDKPLEDVGHLEKNFSLNTNHPLIISLKELDTEITAIRKTGENILAVSKELDKSAREKVDGFIHASRTAILVFFPLFLAVGFGIFLFVMNSVVRRLRILTSVVEKAGAGAFDHVAQTPEKWSKDEVGVLIEKFNYMEDRLSQREKELLHSRKLAAIGTFAAGVAHELNNPLNNIYTTAQRLLKKSGDECPPAVKKGLDDIFGQTMRVKSIVGELLEFARGREPHFTAVELRNLISAAYRHLGNTPATERISFAAELHPPEIVIYADPEQMEQVFINLFSNAVDAMSGEGGLSVKAVEEDDHVVVRVADTGKGMGQETTEKIFEPFYTTKDKGTGLGLSIVFNIIQKHRGHVRVESKENEGTTFIISLPKNIPGTNVAKSGG